MKYVLSYTLRTVIVFAFTYLGTRSLSSKAMSQMSAYEVAALMILANVASEPIVDKVTVKSVYGVGLLVMLIMLFAWISTINKLTPIMEHTPTILMQKGELIMKNLKTAELSLNQLEGLIRQQGYDKLSDLDTIIMEPQGNVSVFPKPEYRPVQLKDLKLKDNEAGFTIPVIMDGGIIYSNIKHLGKSVEWLEKELVKQGIYNYKEEVAFAEVAPGWQLKILKK